MVKKLILIFGVFAIICVIISVALSTPVESKAEEKKDTHQTQSQRQKYVVKSLNGKVVLFYGDTLLYRTETSVNTLPKKDARQLLYGISVETREQAERVIEEYCS